MREVEVIMIRYNPESRIKMQHKEINPYPYLTAINGYEKEEERTEKNGYTMTDMSRKWLGLKKPEAVVVTVRCDDVRMQFEIKADICKFYKKENLSSELYDRFCDDVTYEKIKLYLDDNDKILIK